MIGRIVPHLLLALENLQPVGDILHHLFLAQLALVGELALPWIVKHFAVLKQVDRALAVFDAPVFRDQDASSSGKPFGRKHALVVAEVGDLGFRPALLESLAGNSIEEEAVLCIAPVRFFAVGIEEDAVVIRDRPDDDVLIEERAVMPSASEWRFAGRLLRIRSIDPRRSGG